jgi:hypothetical protein
MHIHMQAKKRHPSDFIGKQDRFDTLLLSNGQIDTSHTKCSSSPAHLPREMQTDIVDRMISQFLMVGADWGGELLQTDNLVPTHPNMVAVVVATPGGKGRGKAIG